MHDDMIVIRVTKTEKNLIRKNAKKKDQTISDYIREILFSKKKFWKF